MKRFKLLTSLGVLALTICTLAFGVFAAVKAEFTASGSISFNASSANIDFEILISGLKPSENGADASGEKTLYGTTFVGTVEQAASRTNYVAVSDSTVSLKTGVADLSTANASFALGTLAFDELNTASDHTNKITILIKVFNYSSYSVQASTKMSKIDGLLVNNNAYVANQTVDLSTSKLTATSGSDTITLTYSITPTETPTQVNAAAFSIAVSVEPYTGPALPTAKANLAAYSWAEIKQFADAVASNAISASDLSSTYNISIGSTKTANITVAQNTQETHTYRLVGINHDVDASGNTLGFTFEQIDLISANAYKMKLSTTSTDSWVNSDLKTTIDAFAFETDLNNVITPAKKACVESVSSATLTYVTSKLWLMSETEIAGTQTFTYGSVAEGTQYAYYTTNNTANDRIKQKSSSACYYWLRSAHEWNRIHEDSYFAVVFDDGVVNDIDCDGWSGVAPCFCI